MKEFEKIFQDPIYFAEKYFYILTTDGGKQLIKVYPKQADMINTMCKSQRTIVLSARQTGKCVDKDTKILVRNKKTMTEEEIRIEDFFKKFDSSKRG